jgi:soluble lytic murein transglycosylase
MPATARYIARKISYKFKKTSKLFDTDVNIRLGVAYLDYIHNYYKGHPVLATAAYNAGKGRVNRWLPQNREFAADVWIETIPYRETRNYTRNVMAFTTVYENRLGIPLTPLHKRMPPIRPAEKQTSSIPLTLGKKPG